MGSGPKDFLLDREALPGVEGSVRGLASTNVIPQLSWVRRVPFLFLGCWAKEHQQNIWDRVPCAEPLFLVPLCCLNSLLRALETKSQGFPVFCPSQGNRTLPLCIGRMAAAPDFKGSLLDVPRFLGFPPSGFCFVACLVARPKSSTGNEGDIL